MTGSLVCKGCHAPLSGEWWHHSRGWCSLACKLKHTGLGKPPNSSLQEPLPGVSTQPQEAPPWPRPTLFNPVTWERRPDPALLCGYFVDTLSRFETCEVPAWAESHGARQDGELEQHLEGALAHLRAALGRLAVLGTKMQEQWKAETRHIRDSCGGLGGAL